MITNIRAIWIMARVMLHSRLEVSEVGSVVEKVILTAIFAALALAIGAIIVAKAMLCESTPVSLIPHACIQRC